MKQYILTVKIDGEIKKLPVRANNLEAAKMKAPNASTLIKARECILHFAPSDYTAKKMECKQY